MKNINEIRGKVTLIPLKSLIEILLSKDFYEQIKLEKYESTIEASQNLATIFNFFLSNSAVFKPVLNKIETDKGIMNPEKSIILLINGKYYDLTNKIYEAEKIKILEMVSADYHFKKIDKLISYIRNKYLEDYINNYKNKMETLKKSDINKILKVFNYSYNKLFNETIQHLVNIDFALFFEDKNYDIDYNQLLKEEKEYYIQVYKDIADKFILKEGFNLLKENLLNDKLIFNFEHYTENLFNIVLKEKRINWKLLQERIDK